MTKLIYPSRRRFMGLAGAVGASMMLPPGLQARQGRHAASRGQGRRRHHGLGLCRPEIR